MEMISDMDKIRNVPNLQVDLKNHRPNSFNFDVPSRSGSPIISSTASPASLSRSQSLRDNKPGTTTATNFNLSRLRSIHNHNRSKSQHYLGMDNSSTGIEFSRGSLELNRSKSGNGNSLKKPLISPPILDNKMIPMYLSATNDDNTRESNLTSTVTSAVAPVSPRKSILRNQSSPRKPSRSSHSNTSSLSDYNGFSPQLTSPKRSSSSVHVYTQVGNATQSQEYTFPSPTLSNDGEFRKSYQSKNSLNHIGSRTSLTTPSNLPPMPDVWLDDDDEDEAEKSATDHRRKSLGARLRTKGIPSSSSMSALSAAATTVNKLPTIYSEATHSASSNDLTLSSNVSPSKLKSHKNSNSLAFSNFRMLSSRKRSSTVGSLQISQPIMAVPYGTKVTEPTHASSPQTPKQTTSTSKHKHSSSLQSTTSTVTVTANSQSKTPSSASKLIKSFFVSPSTKSPTKHSRSLSKDLISGPSNFVHRSHLDAEKSVVSGVSHSTSSKELSSFRQSREIQKSPQRRVQRTHLRENSSSSSASVSTAQGSIVTSVSSANTLHTAATTPLSASARTPENSSAEFIAPTSTIPVIPPRQRLLSFSKEPSKPTPQQPPQPLLNKQQSVDSFGSWATPNSDFVEQQRWLLNNMGDSESLNNSTPSTPCTAATSKQIRKIHSSQESFWHGYMNGNSSPVLSSAASTTSTTTPLDNGVRKSLLLPSPLLSSNSSSSPGFTLSDHTLETSSIQQLRVHASKSDLHDVEEEEESFLVDSGVNRSAPQVGSELTWF